MRRDVLLVRRRREARGERRSEGKRPYMDGNKRVPWTEYQDPASQNKRRGLVVLGSLSFVLQFLDEMRKAFLFALFETPLMAEIKIISQPFQTLRMESFRDLFLCHKRLELDFGL